MIALLSQPHREGHDLKRTWADVVQEVKIG